MQPVAPSLGELDLDRVSVRFGDTLAVDEVSLRVRGAEIVAVLGPSGCGKSSLLRAIAGLEPLSSGRVLFDGADQRDVAVHRRRFGLMFQDGQLFEHLSVGANVGYGPRRQGVGRTDVSRLVAELLQLVGLDGYADRVPSTLSGGERQRVALARALAAKPRLVLLDEPLSALDASLRVRLAADVRRVLREKSMMALLVTHDHEEAFAIADRVMLMRRGVLVQSGTPREVWSNPVDEEAALFLGYARVLRGEQLAALEQHFGVGHDPLALRVNALRVADGGPLRARVLAVAPTVDEQRLVVRLPDGQELDAVAPLDDALEIDDEVGLDLVRSATAVIASTG